MTPIETAEMYIDPYGASAYCGKLYMGHIGDGLFTSEPISTFLDQMKYWYRGSLLHIHTVRRS